MEVKSPSIKRPCLECGTLTVSSRCPDHGLRRPANPAYRDPTYRRRRDALVAEHQERFGDLCPGPPDLGHAPHATVDLTVDHIRPLSLGETHDLANLRVRCASASVSKGGANRKRRRRTGEG